MSWCRITQQFGEIFAEGFLCVCHTAKVHCGHSDNSLYEKMDNISGALTRYQMTRECQFEIGGMGGCTLSQRRKGREHYVLSERTGREEP